MARAAHEVVPVMDENATTTSIGKPANDRPTNGRPAKITTSSARRLSGPWGASFNGLGNGG